MANAEQRAENEAKNKTSVAELLATNKSNKDIKKEEKEGSQTELKENKLPLEPKEM
jgi:hypothetical protein